MKYRSTIGIEVAADEVRGACVRTVGNSALLAGVASVPLPDGAKDGEGVLSSQVVGEAIRRVCSQLDSRASSLAMGVTDGSLVVRVFDIPPVPDPEVRSVLRGEMDHYRILPAGQSAFDFYRLPDSADKEVTVDESATTRVLMIGAEERLVASYRAAADTTAMNLVAVEPGALAVLRLTYPTVAAEKAVANVVVSATSTDVLITQEGGLQFYRRIDTGLQDLRPKSQAADVAQSDAAGRGMLLGEEVDFPEAPSSGPDRVNRQSVSALMTEVQRSIDFFKREYPSCAGRVRVLFTLGCDRPTEFYAVFTEYLRSESELAQHFTAIPATPELADTLNGAGALRYAVAAGLALRSAGGDFSRAPAMDLAVGDRVTADRRVAPRLVLASAGVSGLVLVGTMAAALIVNGMIGAGERTLMQTNHELAALAQQHEAQVTRLERQKTLAEAIASTNKPVREGVEFLSASIHRRASLSTITIAKDGVISLTGEAMSPNAVADILDTVNLSPMLEPARLDSLVRLETFGGSTVVSFQMQTAFLPSALGTAAQPSEAPSGNAIGDYVTETAETAEDAATAEDETTEMPVQASDPNRRGAF